jgi:hypothetical protein
VTAMSARGGSRGRSRGRGRGRGREDDHLPVSLGNLVLNDDDEVQLSAVTAMSARGGSRGRSRGRGRGCGREDDHLPVSLGNLVLNDDAEVRLKERIGKLRLKADEVSQNAGLVNELIDEILADLKANTPRNFHWSTLPSGSYYDKTKVSHLIAKL